MPGGVAQQDGRLIPGDRLMFVNDIDLSHACLDEAVQALKGAARGIVRVGVSKPLPVPDRYDFNCLKISIKQFFDTNTLNAKIYQKNLRPSILVHICNYIANLETILLRNILINFDENSFCAYLDKNVL